MLIGDLMKPYIKGTYSRNIFKGDSGYVIGLFKIKETNIDNYEDQINKTITFTGYFHDLTEGILIYFMDMKLIMLNMESNLML